MMCAAISPQATGAMLGVLVCAAVPVLFIWALVTMNNKPKPYTVPYTSHELRNEM